MYMTTLCQVNHSLPCLHSATTKHQNTCNPVWICERVCVRVHVFCKGTRRQTDKPLTAVQTIVEDTGDIFFIAMHCYKMWSVTFQRTQVRVIFIATMPEAATVCVTSSEGVWRTASLRAFSRRYYKGRRCYYYIHNEHLCRVFMFRPWKAKKCGHTLHPTPIPRPALTLLHLYTQTKTLIRLLQTWTLDHLLPVLFLKTPITIFIKIKVQWRKKTHRCTAGMSLFLVQESCFCRLSQHSVQSLVCETVSE